MLRPAPKPNHKRRAPKRSERGKFSDSVRRKAYKRDKGLCQMCFSPGTELHHVMFKSRGGRGVLNNALTLCSICHRKVHDNGDLSDYWINVYADRYGARFWKDEWDV